MNSMDYFLMVEHWSCLWLVGLSVIGISYSLAWKAGRREKVLFYLALGLLYAVFGSPLAALNKLGLHSVNVFQHMVVLMVVPILLLKSLPFDIFARKNLGWVSDISRSSYFIPLSWCIGAMAMWSGHFLTAGILSSKMGVAICGVAVSPNSWIIHIPENLILLFQLLAGLFFALPVFHPDPSQRLAPLKSVAYLFTACVSCSILGLYIAFSASSVTPLESVPIFHIIQNPFPMTFRTDQEMAGLLMWVPGCIIYVASSMDVLLKWYQNGETLDQNRTITQRDPGEQDSIWAFTKTKHSEL